jgi:homoserine trans-succinylase
MVFMACYRDSFTIFGLNIYLERYICSQEIKGKGVLVLNLTPRYEKTELKLHVILTSALKVSNRLDTLSILQGERAPPLHPRVH